MKSLKDVYGYSAKKLTAEGLRNIIQEEIALLDEEADASKVDPDVFPLELSKAAAKAGEEAERLATKGDQDGNPNDDAVQASAGSMPVKDLKPSQSSMNIAIAALRKVEPFPGGPGGDLGAIITSDNHIMDGHHRWIATGMVDPNASVGGVVVEFPAKQMIAALNMITVSLGITTGKPGTGGFGQFNEAGIKAELAKALADGVWAGSASEVQAALEEFTGETGDAVLDAASKKMAENVAQLELSVPGGFPERPDMPVISAKKGHLDKAVALLRSGQVDLNPPYAEEGAEKQEESRRQEGDLIMERWKRLAGIL